MMSLFNIRSATTINLDGFFFNKGSDAKENKTMKKESGIKM